MLLVQSCLIERRPLNLFDQPFRVGVCKRAADADQIEDRAVRSRARERQFTLELLV